MTNPYYNHGSFPATNSAGASASMRAELDAIAAGFNKLPATLTANNVVFINSSGTALEARAGIDGVVIGGTTPAAGSFTTLTLSSALVLPAGSVGAPGAAFSGDTNNGWWAPAADTQAWSLAGAEAMRLSSAGLGLGVTAARPLHVKSATQSQVRIETTTARGSGQVTIELSDPTGTKGYFGYGSANDILHLYQGLNQALAVFTNGATRAQFPAAGGLLIETPTSGNSLTLNANSAALISFAAGSTAAASLLGPAADATLYSLLGKNAVAGPGIQARWDSATTNRYMEIGSYNNAGTWAPAMRFADGNLVGVGTTAPQKTFVIANGTAAGLEFSPTDYAGNMRVLAFNRTSSLYVALRTEALQHELYISGAQAALLDTNGQFGIGVNPTSMLDVSKAGTPVVGRFRAAAGFAAGLQMAGNNNTAGTTSFDLQQDSAGNADIVQRNNARLSLYTNGIERLRIDAGGTITDQTTGAEFGFKGLPSASVTTGAFVAGDRGKCVYATAGVTIPNGVMTSTDTVIVQNTTGSAITITKTITTAYNTSTGAALGATFTLGARGRMAIVFNSSSECYVSGNIS